jgi:hypothetical protein
MRGITLLAVIVGLLGLGFYVQLQKEAPLLVVKEKNYLEFQDVIVSQISENRKLWELQVKKAELTADKNQILLKECTGFVFDEDRQPIYRLVAPEAILETSRNRVIFKRPAGQTLGAGPKIVDQIFLNEMEFSSELKKILGQGQIRASGPHLEVRAGRLESQEKLKKFVLSEEPVLEYLKPDSSKIILKSPFIEADQKQQVLRAAGPVQLFWKTLVVNGRSAVYFKEGNVFVLFGPVKIIYNNLAIEGEKLSFFPEKEEIVLTGPLVARRGAEILQGEKMRIFIKEGRLKLENVGELQLDLESKNGL